jgi:23S rRNA (uracil1939-C5)-methyltransferase
MENERKCEYRRKCGACQTLNLSYEEELSLKMKREIALLGRFGHVSEIIPSSPSGHYRNKAQYLFRFESGRIRSGLYRSSDNGIADIDSCLMEDEEITAIYSRVRKLVRKYGVKVFDGRRGDLRHVMIRKAVRTGEISVTFVTFGGHFAGEAKLADELISAHPGIVTVTEVKNDTGIPLWMEGEEHIIRGPGYITDMLCGRSFRIPPKAFYQINPYSTEKLYEKAAEFAAVRESDRVLDAYCGIGTVGITAVSKNGCAGIEGFDVNRDAVETARINAESNGIGNSGYRCVSDSRYVLKQAEKFDVVLTDPPRSGCDRNFINTLLRLEPERIVYISCDPESLARDLNILKKRYEVRKIQPMDMFPGTNHVETVTLIARAE